MKLLLLSYCAFAYGFELNNVIDLILDDELYEEYDYPYLIPVVALVVFLFAPIIMPLNWLVNTIKFMKEK